MCGDCHSLEWNAEPVSGRGTVYTWIVSHHPTEPDAEIHRVEATRPEPTAQLGRRLSELELELAQLQKLVHRQPRSTLGCELRAQLAVARRVDGQLQLAVFADGVGSARQL